MEKLNIEVGKLKIIDNNQDYLLIVGFDYIEDNLHCCFSVLKNDEPICNYWFYLYVQFRPHLTLDKMSRSLSNKVIEETNKIIKAYQAFL